MVMYFFLNAPCAPVLRELSAPTKPLLSLLNCFPAFTRGRRFSFLFLASCGRMSGLRAFLLSWHPQVSDFGGGDRPVHSKGGPGGCQSRPTPSVLLATPPPSQRSAPLSHWSATLGPAPPHGDKSLSSHKPGACSSPTPISAVRSLQQHRFSLFALRSATILPRTCCPVPATMCRTLATFPNTCLERAKEFKTRLGIFLHKSELSSDTGGISKFEWASKHSKERSFSEDVLGWRDSFDLLLNSKNGVAAFHAFLKTEFSEENLEFWLACEEFKKIRSATKLASRAHHIFDEYIRSEAPKEVNIDHETRELTKTNLQAVTTSCFDVAQGKTRTLMEKDSYPRFLKSPAYRDLAAQAAATSTSASNSSPAEPSHT